MGQTIAAWIVLVISLGFLVTWDKLPYPWSWLALVVFLPTFIGAVRFIWKNRN